MAAARILFPDFREEQKDSRYPFADTATLRATDGVTSFQRDTFIDAAFYIIGAGQRVFISSIVVTPQRITVNISDETQTDIAAASFAPNPVQIPENGALDVTDQYGRPAGTMIVTTDNVSLFSGWAPGTYEFDIEATEFVSTTVIPTREPGVRGVKVPGTDIFTGDIWLIGDGGVVFRYEGVQNGFNVIRVDIAGVPLFNRFICIPFERFVPKNFVKTINNCSPDEYGNFTITATGQKAADTVLRITQENDIIFIDAIGRKVV